MPESDYILQYDPKSFCPKCGKNIYLLCRKDNTSLNSWHYICWDCRLIAQLGKGEVKLLTARE